MKQNVVFCANCPMFESVAHKRHIENHDGFCRHPSDPDFVVKDETGIPFECPLKKEEITIALDPVLKKERKK